MCVDDKSSKSLKSYLSEDAVYNFISSMIEESEYYSDVIKKHFNKELVINKRNNKDFENSTKCWIYGNAYFDGDVKVRYHCHITGKYRGFAHRYCNISAKLNHKISVVFRNLKNYDPHLLCKN